jgi:ketosteroid isomerase-like protein
MHTFQDMVFRGTAVGVFIFTLNWISPGQAQTASPNDEQTIWNLERAYWRYVQHNNLAAYRNLWHEDFLGWPSISAAPVRKDHITDWITSRTSKGLVIKTIDLKPAAIHKTGKIVMVFYWVTNKWVDKKDRGEPNTDRITHTWLKEGKNWKIIGGMSMPEAAPREQ